MFCSFMFFHVILMFFHVLFFHVEVLSEQIMTFCFVQSDSDSLEYWFRERKRLTGIFVSRSEVVILPGDLGLGKASFSG